MKLGQIGKVPAQARVKVTLISTNAEFNGIGDFDRISEKIPRRRGLMLWSWCGDSGRVCEMVDWNRVFFEGSFSKILLIL